MKSIVALCFALSLSAQTAAPVVTPTHTIVLFNGRNLDGWYTWLQEDQYQDPKDVFSVENGMIRVSGEEWGGLTSKSAYRDYHLVVE